MAENEEQLSEFRAEREASTHLSEITIRTRVPSKWRFVDLETGDVWMSYRGAFVRADDGRWSSGQIIHGDAE